jgi:hypothetical protein
LADFCSSDNGIADREIGEANSLARTIGEFREEVLSWIDTELARLQELQWEEDRSMEAMSGMPGSIRFRPRDAGILAPPTICDGDREGTLDDVCGTERGMIRSRGWPNDQDSSTDVDESPIAVQGPAMDLGTQSTPCHPGERLDALARRLDHRLKQAAGVPKTPPDTAGRGKGTRNEPRAISSSRAAGWSLSGDSTVERGR